MGRSVLLVDDDGFVARKLGLLAGELGLVLCRVGDDPPPRELVAVVVDLERPDALEELAFWREEAPEALLVCHLTAPRRDLWEKAERLGCDLVTNRGALVPRLRALLSAGGGQGRRLFPLLDAADVAGRRRHVALARRTGDPCVGGQRWSGRTPRGGRS